MYIMYNKSNAVMRETLHIVRKQNTNHDLFGLNNIHNLSRCTTTFSIHVLRHGIKVLKLNIISLRNDKSFTNGYSVL